MIDVAWEEWPHKAPELRFKLEEAMVQRVRKRLERGSGTDGQTQHGRFVLRQGPDWS